MINYINIEEKSENFILIHVNITDRRTYRRTHQKYSSEPHKELRVINFILKKSPLAFSRSLHKQQQK